MPDEIERGPMAGVAGAARAARPQKTLEQPLDDLERAKYEKLLGATRSPLAVGAAPRALLVDSDLSARQTLAAVLAAWDLEVAQVSGGREALLELADRRVDLLVLDLKLSGCDGFEVIRGARSYLKLRETVIIVLSSLSDPEDETAALNIGADSFYAKPAPPKTMEARLKPLARRIWDRYQ